jgi:hypothetical protein
VRPRRTFIYSLKHSERCVADAPYTLLGVKRE